jgi:AAA domain/Bifunctional DNA primase/polymerase, N-terminal
MTAFFDFAERHRFALFPCAQGTKRPILKWKAGSTHDRAQWATWQSEHNNLAIDCAKSEIIMIDVDASKVTREEAWGAYYALCLSWELPGAADAMTQSARGGWHIPFRRPAKRAATDLRGGGTLVKISDIRPLTEGEEDGEVVGFKNRGYCVAPGSTLSTSAGNLPYMLMTNPPAPHVAPEGLLEAINLKTIEATYSGQTGTSDKADVAKLVAELDMFGEFSTEPDCWKYMGAIKLALGDTENGVEVALQMTTDDATAEAFWSRWNRLASVDDGGPKCRINSMIHRYKELTGKHFNVRTSAAVMFDGVPKDGPGMPPVPTVVSPSIAPDMPAQLSADERASLGAIATAAEKERTEKAKASGEQTTSTENKPALPRYLFETVSDLRSMPPQTWLVDRWIPDRSVGIIYGRFASGKSFIAFDLLLHLVYGMENWHGVTLPGIPCCGLLIAREGGTGFQRRVDAFKKHHNITDDTDRMVFMRSPVNFGDPAQFAELKTVIETCGRQFKVVVVDTVGRALPGEDMFDPKSITRFMEHLQQIGEIAQGVSIGIHHENKAGDVMGSIYFDNNSDFMFHVEREGDPAQGPLRRGKITCVKQKDGEDGWARDVSYKFVDTDPNGEGSLVIDSLTGSGAASKVTAKLTPKEGLALTALSDVLKAKGQLGGDIGGRSVTLDEWKEGCFSNGSVSRDAARPLRDLHDRQVGLITKGRILVLDDRVRLVGGDLKGEPGNVVPMMPTLPSNAVPMPPVTMSMPIPRRPS